MIGAAKAVMNMDDERYLPLIRLLEYKKEQIFKSKKEPINNRDPSRLPLETERIAKLFLSKNESSNFQDFKKKHGSN